MSDPQPSVAVPVATLKNLRDGFEMLLAECVSAPEWAIIARIDVDALLSAPQGPSEKKDDHV